MLRLRSTLLTGLCLTAATACSSGDSSGELTAPLTLALTDAASDELASFVVELTAVELTRPGGARVGVLPEPVVVDLTTLAEVSEILNVINVPLGLYAAADITFDFASAEAFLVGESAPATILDGDGVPVSGTVTLPVSLGGLLNVLGNRNRVLELDFDLDQSVIVDAATNTVFLEPALVLRLDPENPKELRAGGVIQAVDTAASTIDVELQTLSGRRLADVTIAVDGTTVYQVDGVPAVGAAGLSAVAALSQGTWIQCYGAADPGAARIDAAYVEAGTGTYNGGTDIVEGYVTGRVGGAGAAAMLTVLGHSNDATHTSFLFNSTFTVSTDFASTRVVRRGSPLALDTDELNVGQKVRVFGTLSGFNMDATGAGSVVRQQPTRLLAFASGAPAGSELTVDLERVELRSESSFTWSEGGTTPPDPDALVAEVGGLANGLGIAAATPVAVRGFFSAVDDAGADFVATSVVNRALAPSLLIVHDRAGGLAVSPTVSASAITLALSGTADAGELALVDQGFVGAVPLATTPDPQIVPAGSLGFYVLRDRRTGSVALHLDFAAYATALDALLAQGAALYNVTAIGTYDAGTNVLSTGLLTVVVD